MRLKSLFMLAPLLALLPIAAGHSQPVAGVMPAGMAGLAHHSISIKDLGFTRGTQLSGFGQQRDYYFNIPEGVDFTGSKLSLVYDATAAHAARRTLEVSINDRVIVSRPITGAVEDQRLEIALRPAAPGQRLLKVTVRYTGAITEDRCLDERVGGEHLWIRPETALDLSFRPAQVTTAAAAVALMPHMVVIGVPDRHLNGEETRAALQAFRLFRSRGHQVLLRPFGSLPVAGSGTAGSWQTGTILLDAAGAGEVVRTYATGSGPVLHFRGGQLGAVMRRLSFSIDRPLPASLRPAQSPEMLRFSTLGQAPALASLIDKTNFELPFSSPQLPSRTRPSALALDLLVAPDQHDRSAVVSAFVNGELIGAERIGTGERHHLEMPIRPGVLGLTNTARVLVQRQPTDGGCERNPQDYPVELLGTSGLVLAEAPPPQAFFELAPFLRDGVEVRIQSAKAAEERRAIELVGTLLASLTAWDVPILAGNGSGERPFIQFSTDAPKNFTAPVRFDHGRIFLRTGPGEMLFDSTKPNDMLAIQLVRQESGTAGLWIRPLGDLSTMALPETLALDRGDFALVDRQGGVLHADSKAEDLAVDYPDEWSWTELATRHRSAIIAGIWVIVTAGFLFGVRRRLAKRRSRGTGA